jgi:hypothetical protein
MLSCSEIYYLVVCLCSGSARTYSRVQQWDNTTKGSATKEFFSKYQGQAKNEN